jgi:hypothetical protein
VAALCSLSAKLHNGDFTDEIPFGAVACVNATPSCSVHTWLQLDASDVPGWQTTASDNRIELWLDGYKGVLPYSARGSVMEMQANGPASQYQDLATYGGEVLFFSFAHRGRMGVDSMSVSFSAPGGAADQTFGPFADGNASWGLHSGSYTVPAGQATTRVSFNVVSWATAPSRPGNGNLLSAVQVTPAALACPDALVAYIGTTVLDVLANDYGQDARIDSATSLNGAPVTLVDGGKFIQVAYDGSVASETIA